MKPFVVFAIGAAASVIATHAAPATWLTDLATAQANARSENKAVLVNFTGSDWCGWCIRLRREVFNTPEFAAYAEKHLALVEVDFPKRKSQTAALKKANEALSDRFNIEGYPTLVVLDSQGRELGRLGYEPGGPKPFLAQMARLTGRQSEGTTSAQKNIETKAKAGADAPLFNGAPVLPPPRYDDLTLRGISGPRHRRLAMINNQTLSAGETAPLKVGNRQVNVRCVEVREKSVLVAVEGESAQREIKLRGGL